MSKPKSLLREKHLTGPCCSSLEQFDCSLGVFGKAQRPHGLNSKVPLLECGGQSSIFGHTQIVFIVLYCSIHHWILILSWKRVSIIPRTKWFWANPHSHQNYCIYFIPITSSFYPNKMEWICTPPFFEQTHRQGMLAGNCILRWAYLWRPGGCHQQHLQRLDSWHRRASLRKVVCMIFSVWGFGQWNPYVWWWNPNV